MTGSAPLQKKAVVLVSGGLDSILALKLMLEQGVDVVPVHYHIEFASCGGGPAGAARTAKALGVDLKVFDITDEYLTVFLNPKHGYGANVNPCIDCKIFMLTKAKAYMREIGASFLVTGEVLGERPMSQRRDALNIIAKAADVKGILLRPLSAKLLEPTIAEEAGLVDRERLLDIRGRSRKPQMELAAKFGIKEYPQPSGGCLLTDPGFARRVKDLFAHGGVTVESLRLLKTGRQFRLSKKAKLIVGRNQGDNDALERITRDDDICLRFKDRQGPLALIRGEADEETVRRAAAIMAHHSKFRDEGALAVSWWKVGAEEHGIVTVTAASAEDVALIRL